MSTIRGIPGLSDSLITVLQMLLCHYFGVVLLVEVLRLFSRSRSTSGPVAN